MNSVNLKLLLVLLLFALIALTTMASVTATQTTSAPPQALNVAMSPTPALVEVTPAPTSARPTAKPLLGIERLSRFSH
jgi:hypothetical protein